MNLGGVRMADKVILTKEQAEAIEFAKKHHMRHEIIDAYMQINDSRLVDELKVLYQLSYDKFFKALYIGYEVEPEFKVGDWVVWDEIKIIGQLVEIDSVLRVDSIDYDVPQSVKLDELRHATPEEIAKEKERRWWRKHGRDVWELRKGDVLREELSGLLFIVEYTENNIVHFEDTDFDDYENVRNGCKIICFAENRLDREGD